MLLNYLRIALRSIWRQKSFSLTNIFGLAVGMSCFFLISLFVWDEFEFDTFHDKSDRLYRISPPEYARTAPLLSPTLKREIPEVESAIRLKRYSGVVQHNDLEYNTDRLFFAEPDILNMFSFEFVDGDASGALQEPNTVLISETMAEKMFGTTLAAGKTITLLDTMRMQVTGVFKDWPVQSHIDLDILASFENYKRQGYNLDTWSNSTYYTYVLLHHNVEPEQFKSQLTAFTDRNIRTLSNYEEYSLTAQKITSIHLHSVKEMEIGANGSIRQVRIFLTVALMVLMIAIINYVNLATARSGRRVKEIGVRKSIGARRGQLIAQFLGEAMLTTVFAMSLALLLVWISLPVLNQLAEKTISASILLRWPAQVAIWGTTLFTSILAGAYPALILSSFRPSQAFKSVRIKTHGSLSLRSALVVIQFAMSLILIAGTFGVYYQLQFMKNKELGYDHDQILVLPYYWDAHVQSQYEVLKTDFMNLPSVQAVTASGDIPGRMATRMGYRTEEMEEGRWEGMQTLYVHEDFVETYGLQVIAGRGTIKEIASDAQGGYLLNETAVNALGWSPEEAIDQLFTVETDGRVIGVVKDFHYNSLHQTVQPLVLGIRPDWCGFISLRLDTRHLSTTLAAIKDSWVKHISDRPFEHYFLDEDFNRQYLAEAKLARVTRIFAIMAILIAAIGLFGLATFTTERMTKEIAVRKVLGASLSNLTGLLAKEFARPIIWALLLATPLGWWLIQMWLNGFAYRVAIKPEWFVASGLIVLIIAVLSVSWQSVKAVLVQPASWLRNE